MTDDQHAGALGAMGNSLIQTPNLDLLAQKGVVFERCYATNPLCMAARATVMTGMYEYKTGCNFLTGNLGAEDWQQMAYPVLLKKHGYRNGFAGKWGFSIDGVDGREAFDKWGTLQGGQGHYQTQRNPNMFAYSQQYPHVTRALGAFGRDFIGQSVQSNQPFCLSLSFKAPHKPHDIIDPKDQELYKNVTFPYPDSFGCEGLRRLPIQAKLGRQYYQRDEWCIDQYQQHLKHYYQLISGVDSAVGMVLDELEHQKVANHTIIIFTSDNGYFCGAHGLQGKVLPYDDASRIPLIIYHPGLLSAEKRLRTKAVVGNIDFAPTILDAAGIQIPWRMDGASLLPIVNDPMRKVRDVLGIIQNWDWTNRDMTKGLAITSEDWKYINWCYADRNITPAEELFNLNQDPAEMENRIDDPVAAGELTMLRDAYDQFHRHWAKHCVDGPHYKRYQQIFDRHIPWVEKQYLTIDSQLQQIEWQQKLQQQYQDLTGETYPVYDDS